MRHLLILFIPLFISCGNTTEEDLARIEGRVTVSADIDTTADYSNIELLITSTDQISEIRDTLFYELTNREGNFSGVAKVPRKNLYTLSISRYGNRLGLINLVLADNDTISLHAELPDLNESLRIESNENDAFEVYDRLDRNYNRVARFIGTGQLSSDSIALELRKWSDLFWDLYHDRKGTLASDFAGQTSLNLLQGWNDSLMVERAELIIENDNRLLPASRILLTNYYSKSEGLESALDFLSRLESLSEFEDVKKRLQISRIELLFDSAQTDRAATLLSQFENDYKNDELALRWAENMSYDLNVLAPGKPFPNFNVQLTNGDSLSVEDLKGTPFLFEITRLDNQLYQQQYDRTIAIFQIYRNFGLDIVTIPLGATPTALEAFYEERGLLWNVALPGTFDADDLIERLNIRQVPTRFLINEKGEIIRRYVGNDFNDIVRGLQQIQTENQLQP